jgi:hypothetical protein
MSPASAPRLRRWSVVLAAALCVALVPVLLALLAPPVVACDGPCLGAATRDGCTAALDRMERVLAGALDVRLLAPTACWRPWREAACAAWSIPASVPVPAVRASSSETTELRL